MTGLVTLVIGLGAAGMVGIVLAALRDHLLARRVQVPLRTRPEEYLPGHCPHDYGPWSDPLVENIADEDGDVIGDLVIEGRRCEICGHTEFRHESYFHDTED